MRISEKDIKELAKEVGLEFCSALNCDEIPSDLLSDEIFLQKWQNIGFGGEMKYMRIDIRLYSD